MYVPLITAHDLLGQNAGKRGRVTTRSCCGSPLHNNSFFLHRQPEYFFLLNVRKIFFPNGFGTKKKLDR